MSITDVATLVPVSRICYTRGDATRPVGEGPKIIAHVCNDIGAWGSGFVLAVTRRWREPEECYRLWHRGRIRDAGRVVQLVNDCILDATGAFGLGQSQLVGVADDVYVLNMVAQRGLRPASGEPAVRYDALSLCLWHAARFARRHGASLHMPRIGCGLGGGSWDHVGPLVERLVGDVPVTVYDLGEP